MSQGSHAPGVICRPLTPQRLHNLGRGLADTRQRTLFIVHTVEYQLCKEPAERESKRLTSRQHAYLANLDSRGICIKLTFRCDDKIRDQP